MAYGAPSEPVPPNFTEYGMRISRAEREAREIPDDELLRLSIDEIVDLITETHSAPMIDIDYDRVTSALRKPWTQPLPGPIYERELAIYFPARGCTNAMWNRGLPISAQTRGRESVLAFSYPFTSEQLAAASDTQYHGLISQAVNQVRALHKTANAEISSQRDSLNRKVRSIIEPRWHSLNALRRVTSELGIPNIPPTALEMIPLERRGISFKSLGGNLSGGKPEYTLSEEIADEVIEQIIHFGSSLEGLTKTSHEVAESGETTFRDLILSYLGFAYPGGGTGETFRGNGKADIVLNWKNRTAFIAECKIWDGPSRFTKAIDQLLGRYTVWRDTRVALIVFIRDRKNITSIIESAAERIESHPRFLRSIQTEDPFQRRDYLISAVNDELRQVRLSFLPIVISPMP